MEQNNPTTRLNQQKTPTTSDMFRYNLITNTSLQIHTKDPFILPGLAFPGSETHICPRMFPNRSSYMDEDGVAAHRASSLEGNPKGAVLNAARHPCCPVGQLTCSFEFQFQLTRGTNGSTSRSVLRQKWVFCVGSFMLMTSRNCRACTAGSLWVHTPEWETFEVGRA